MRIVIVDDSATIRRLVRSHLEKSPEWKICGEADDGNTGVELVRKLNPDCIVLDFSMPTMNGLDAAQRIAAISPNTRVVLFTAHDTGVVRARATAVGIKAVVSKDGKDCLDALLCALRGNEQRAA